MALIERYIQAAVLRAFVLAAAALTMLFSLLDFTDQLASVGQGRYRLADAFAYVLLTVPSRLLQAAPVAMLLGCLLGLGAFARHSELTAMRSLGISEHRIVLYLIKLAFPIILALFLMAEFVIPPAEQLAQSRHALSLPATSRGGGFWAQGGNQFLNVQRFGPDRMPQGIDIYSFTTDGSLTSVVHADRAEARPDGTWRLGGVTIRRVAASQFQVEHVAALSWHSFIPIAQIRLLMLPPEAMPPLALYRYVRGLERRHRQAIRYDKQLWTQIGIPVSLLAMIMIAMPLVLGPPRVQSIGQQITIGGVIGIVFSLSQQIAGYLDLLFDLNHALTELAPSLLLMALALYLFRRAAR